MNLQQSLNKIRQHISLGEIESAEDMTRRLRRKRPNHREVQFLEGCVQYQKGNYREAIRRFRKLLDKQPGNLDVRMNLAVTLLGAGKEEEAASLLREVTAQQPHNYMAWYNLANAWSAGSWATIARQSPMGGVPSPCSRMPYSTPT